MSNLPFNLKAADLKYPTAPRGWKYGDPRPHQLLHTITLYETTRMGWVVTTLHIRNPGRRSRQDAQARTYGITADGQVCRVGLGPHVKQTLTVYVRADRAQALAKLIELHSKGMEDAGTIRDRISTRRAQGAMRRANWMDRL